MPLTPKGIEQANELAQKIKHSSLRFDNIYTSPLQRARKTAELISIALHMDPPEEISDLKERDFGIMTGQQQSEIKLLCSPNIIETEKITYFLDPEGAETFPQLIERANHVLETLLKRHTKGSILLVTHGDFGKMLYTAYYQLDWRSVLSMFHFGNSELLELSESSTAEDTHIFNIQQHNS